MEQDPCGPAGHLAAKTGARQGNLPAEQPSGPPLFSLRTQRRCDLGASRDLGHPAVDEEAGVIPARSSRRLKYKKVKQRGTGARQLAVSSYGWEHPSQVTVEPYHPACTPRRRVPGTRKISKFTPKGGTDVCSSTLLLRGRRKLVFRQLRWCCGLTAQPAAPMTPDCHEFGRELRRPTLVQARAQSRWDWMCMGDTDPDFAARSGSV
ncbi:hypothetical protein Anapl_09384 [Anas platyrhynchos]|uniref:Uncharacterized protein n=1 Tax=Anas platyrhynchos TaxID=8839 RepID=R0K9R2_ANAPL|nr:hypothetical protein Anapl_09384 [Anas platyrhynchos]